MKKILLTLTIILLVITTTNVPVHAKKPKSRYEYHETKVINVTKAKYYKDKKKSNFVFCKKLNSKSKRIFNCKVKKLVNPGKRKIKKGVRILFVIDNKGTRDFNDDEIMTAIVASIYPISY